MAENTQLLRPAAGESVNLPVGPDARLEFTFNQGDADLGKDGQNLVFTFGDGAKITLEGFYDNFGDDKQPPTFVVDGGELPGEQFLAALNNPDLLPAAGPAAGPMLGGGAYEDALLSGVGGVDRLDKLEFDGWGRATEVDEARVGVPDEIPGGTFGVSGNSYDMNGMFVQSGMYEDWRPNQHVGDYGTKLLGKLDFDFTPTGTTVVDAIHLSGFDAGTVIVIGQPQFDADGNLVNGVVVTGPEQVFDFTQSSFNSSGVYVLPPPNSDHDMSISVSIDMHAQSSGRTGTINGSFTIVVDAVADQPFVQDASFDNDHLAGQVGAVQDGDQTTDKHFTKDGYHVVEQHTDGTEQVAVTVPFETTVKFGDYEDGSEAHYVLIEVPTQPGGAAWACMDASGNPVGTMTGPDGKEYFQLPVDNAVLAANNGEITVNVNLTVSGDAATVKDTEMNLKVGAMAVENPEDRELDLDNNISFDWKAGGADLNLDVVDGGLKVTAGWASEGNNDAKHLFEGASSGRYGYTGIEAGATGNEAGGKVNTGAPIVIEAGKDSHGAVETITSVTFSYNASEGHIFQWDGAKWVDLDPAGTGRVSLDGLNTGRLDGLVYRPNEGSYSDANVDMNYHVDVKNSVGVTGEYNGGFTVVVDAVADMSTKVVADAGPTHLDDGSHSYGSWGDAKDSNVHGKDGWETDTFQATHYGSEHFTVHVETSFPDMDGSEKHYILIQVPADGDAWSVVDLPPGYVLDNIVELVPGSGEYYYKIEVEYQPGDSGDVSVDITLQGTAFHGGDINESLKTGSMAVEQVQGGTGEGREYDLDNNTAVRIDGTVILLQTDFINSKLTVQTGWASEGNNDAKHLGQASDGYKYGGQEAGATGNLTDGKTNTGAPITFGLSGAVQGSAESISEVKFTFDGERGTLVNYGSGVLTGPIQNGDGTVSYTLSLPAGATNVEGVRFVPAASGPQAYNDADVGMKYDVTVSNAAGSHHTFSGTSTVIIDAVADMPTASMTGPVYHYTDGHTYDAATAGTIVSFQVTASFPDVYGSENHFVLVQVPPQNSHLTMCDANGVDISGNYKTVTIGGDTYYKIPVPNDQQDNALDVFFKVDDNRASAKDADFTLKTGAMAEVDESAGRIDKEYDQDNNRAVAINPPATIKVDYLDTTSKQSVVNMYEDNQPNQHLGNYAAGAASDGTLTIGLVNNQGKFLLGGDTSTKMEGDVTITFKFDGPGDKLTFTMGGKTYEAERTAGTNEFTLKVPSDDLGNGTGGTLKYVPPANDDHDLKELHFDVDIRNTATGEPGHLDGRFGTTDANNKLIVDAVADKPTNVGHGDVSYSLHSEGDGGTGAPVPVLRVAPAVGDDGGGKDVPHESATWGSKIGFTASATFHDIADSSEKHYMLIEAKTGWTGDYTQTVEVGGVKYFVVDVNAAIDNALANGGSYQDGDVRVSISIGADGQPHASVSLDVHLTLPQAGSGSYTYMNADGLTTVKVAGYAVEGEIKFDAGGKGSLNLHGGDTEITTANNTAVTTNDVPIKINVVETKPVVSISNNHIYENLTPDANKGDYTESNGATITLGGLAKGEEADITFNFDFVKGGAGQHTFDSAPEHQDDVMRLEVVNGSGQVIGAYPVTWDDTAGKWTCTVSVDDAAKNASGDVTIIFKPGYNYNSTDIGIGYEIKVTDPKSGDEKTWPSGSASLPELTVVVDAVAQQPDLKDDTTSSYDRTGGTDAFVGGGTVDIGVKVEFQDFTDGSERHYVLVEAQVGWQAPNTTLTIVDANGQGHNVTVNWVMQMIDGKMYFKAEVDNTHIKDWGQGDTGGEMDIHVKMQSPPGTHGHIDISVGAGSWEDKAMVDGEIRWDNNSAFDFTKVGMDFNNVGDFGLRPAGWVFENDTPNAHGGDPVAGTYDGEHAGGTRLTVTVSHPGDVINDFHFNNYGQITADGGKIYYQGPNGLVEINADGTIPGNPTLTGGENFVFIPGHNYSDKDINVTYGGTITDPHSGQTASPGHSSQILVDAVAQAPSDVEHNPNATVHYPGTGGNDTDQGSGGGHPTFTVTVSASFEDYKDGSESHYILVEALPNMKPIGALDGTFSVRDPDTGEYTTYWKVPVSNAAVAAGGGTISVNVTYEVYDDYTRPGANPPGSLKVGALAVEHPSDNEQTYHNNFGVTEGGAVNIDGWHGWNGPGWYGMEVEAGYENDRPNSHKGDENPAGGALVHFGTDATSADVTWDASSGYFIDAQGNTVTGGSGVLDTSAGPWHFVPTGHGDTDVKLDYVIHGSRGDHNGTTTIVIDAVANKPAGLDHDARVDYGQDSVGNSYTAMGKPDGHGNDGDVKIHVSGDFVDNDGSEKHYALVEAQPGWDVPGGEMVYLDGKAYYRVEMAKNPDGSYATDEHGKQYADVPIHVSNPAAVGSGGHDLKTGLMAEEANSGRPGNLEERLDNNVSWTLGGNAHIETSFVDSSVSVGVPGGVYEGDGTQGFPVTINGTLGANDEFHGMTVSASGGGHFVVTDTANVGGWHLDAGGRLVIDDFNAVGKIGVTFVPDAHSDKDINFSWSATFSDTKSGDQQSYGAAPTTIIDAVANAPSITGKGFESDSGHEAALSREGANLTTNLHFDDLDGSEKHYAVLEQGGTWLCDSVTVNGVDYPIITIFTQDQKPVYAVELPDSVLRANNGDVNITWHVTAPGVTHDVDATLKAGGISVETTTGAGADKELTLTNNWAENIQGAPVHIGVFETTGVGLSKSGSVTEDDTNGVGLHLQNPAAGTHEIITQTELTFAQPGAKVGDVIGVVKYDGRDYEVVVGADGKGHVIIDFSPNGYNPAADFRFAATDSAGNPNHNSGSITVGANSTVEDVRTGESHSFQDQQQTFTVKAVADAPQEVHATGPADPAYSGGAINVTVTAHFDDVDGSEKHYVLVEAKDGWTCGTTPYTSTVIDGVKYFQVEVSGTQADVTKTITLTPNEPVLGDHTVNLATGGLAVDKNQGGGVDNSNGFTSGDTVPVQMHDDARLSLTCSNTTVTEGGDMHFTLTLAGTADGRPFTAPENMSVTLRLTGSGDNPASAEDLKLDGWTETPAGSGIYEYTLTLPNGASSVGLSIPVLKDGVLEHSVEGVRVEVVGSNVPAGLAGNVTPPAGGYDVSILDADSARLVIEPSSPLTVTEGDSLSFDLKLQTPNGDATTAAEAMTVSFIVSGLTVDGNAMDLAPNLFPSQPQTDAHGNTMTWSYNAADQTYTMTATLAPGNSVLTVSAEAALSHGTAGVIDDSESLRFVVAGIDSNGLPLLAGDQHISQGTPIEFTVQDQEYVTVSGHGIGSEAVGMHLQEVDPNTHVYDGSNETVGQVIVGTDGDDTIYAGQGNDILVGGGGADIFVWNNDNIGGTDVIKDFNINNDTVRFDDLFGSQGAQSGAPSGQENLESLLSGGQWDSHTNTFTASDANGTSISFKLDAQQAAATLTVSYQDATDSSITHTQNVQFDNFNFQPPSGSELDTAQVTQMLEQIIKVGG